MSERKEMITRNSAFFEIGGRRLVYRRDRDDDESSDDGIFDENGQIFDEIGENEDANGADGQSETDHQDEDDDAEPERDQIPFDATVESLEVDGGDVHTSTDVGDAAEAAAENSIEDDEVAADTNLGQATAQIEEQAQIEADGMVVAEGNRATVDADLGVATARGQAQIEADEMVVAEANRATVDANLGVATAPAQAQFVDESGALDDSVIYVGMANASLNDSVVYVGTFKPEKNDVPMKKEEPNSSGSYAADASSSASSSFGSPPDYTSQLIDLYRRRSTLLAQIGESSNQRGMSIGHGAQNSSGPSNGGAPCLKEEPNDEGLDLLQNGAGVDAAAVKEEPIGDVEVKAEKTPDHE